MPRENRKRGKKHKKQPQEEDKAQQEVSHYQEEAKEPAGPSWIVERSGESDQPSLSDAPFGYVDLDVKAYFKTVDTKLREWQETDDGAGLDDSGNADPNEERRMFLVAALQELSGKEKELATDPECSNVMERMAYSMDDFVKRVLFDRLAGSYDKLSRHRFGSHVVQTLLSVAKGTICREARGALPSPETDDDEKGSLPLLTELIVNIGDELLPSTTSLLMDPFASHVLRALFVLLCPTLPSAADSSSILRSKKSARHRAKQGPLKSVFANEKEEQDDAINEKGKEKSVPLYPEEFEAVARRFVKTVKDKLNANEVRALAADKVACPVLVLLLEMESIQGTSNETGSLMDSVSAGLVSATLQSETPEPSDYVLTLLRDQTSSHLLEKLIALVPEPVFNVMWDLYFSGKLNRLAVHPVANFVVARAIERANADQLSSALEELKGVWPKIINSARTGVLKALIDRAAQLKCLQEEVAQVPLDVFDLHTSEERLLLVECVLYLKTHSALQETLEIGKDEEGQVAGTSSLDPTVQGSVLAQSLLRLESPHNQMAIQSLIRLPAPRLLSLAHHPTSSRIIDALFESPSVPPNARRQLILAFQGHFPALVDDRIGSRVGERLWAAADPYLKEKIARGLIPYENALVGSRYGKYFMRGLNLYLLKRNPEEWKTQQARGGSAGHAKAGSQVAEVKSLYAPNPHPESKQNREEKKRKRKRKEESHDEIDALFSSALGKKQKGSLEDVGTEETSALKPTKKPEASDLLNDKNLSTVLSAIRNAPKDVKVGAKKKK